MNILLLTTSFPRFPGDHAGSFVFELARGLRERGCAVTVVAPHEKALPGKEEMEGISVRRFRYLWPGALEQVAYGFGIPENVRHKFWAIVGLPFLVIGFLFRALREARRAELIHVHWEIAALVGWITGKIHRKPVVMTVHRLVARTPFSIRLTRFLLTRMDDLHFNSSYTREKARKLLRGESKGEIVHPSIEPNRFVPGPPTGSLAKRCGFSPQAPVILTVGRLVEKKGAVYLLEAFARLCANDGFSAVLVFAGGGPLLPALQQRARELAPASRTFFLDFVSAEEVPGLLREASVFVFPSIEDRKGEVETLGIAAIESLAAGVPVIASDVGGIPDVIEDGRTGVLVPPGNAAALAEAIARVLGDSALCERLKSAGLRKAREIFSWDQALSRTLSAYHRLIP